MASERRLSKICVPSLKKNLFQPSKYASFSATSCFDLFTKAIVLFYFAQNNTRQRSESLTHFRFWSKVGKGGTLFEQSFLMSKRSYKIVHTFFRSSKTSVKTLLCSLEQLPNTGEQSITGVDATLFKISK